MIQNWPLFVEVDFDHILELVNCSIFSWRSFPTALELKLNKMEIFYFFLLFLDEACDCGFKEDCEKLGDSCCYPADTPEKYLRCTLKPGKQCSPSQGPCCNGEICKFKPSTVECSSEVDCTEAQNCNGNSAQCPKPKSKPDNSKLYHMNRILK